MAEIKRNNAKNGADCIVQNIHIESRERLDISGVIEVISFDERFVNVKTELGRLSIRGEGMKLANLNPESKELSLTGYVYSCEYEDTVKKNNLLRGMFR